MIFRRITLGLRRRLHTIAIAAVLAILSIAELALANRKYGLFTGGFGQSQAVDTPLERFVFAVGYSVSMTMMVVGTWWIIARFTKARRNWAPIVQFATIVGGLFVTLLTLNFQLHSYFSDTMSFALMANLGGGSITDALLFASNEIVLGAGALIVTVAGYHFGFRWLKRKFPPGRTRQKWNSFGKPAAQFAGSTLLLAMMVPMASTDVNNGLNRTLVWKYFKTVANTATDFDGDGYGLVSRMPDRHPFDSDRHPLALDIPGNGIDEDGYGGDLKLLPDTPVTANQTIAGDQPNLIIIVMESTRYDVLGKRIGGRPVAPNLEAIAHSGSAITPAYSHVGFTTASLKSIFTGSLSPAKTSPSLFRELKASGYHIGVFSGQPEDFGDISETVGMRSNADIFVDGTKLKHLRAFSNGAQGSILIDEKHIINAFDEAYADPALWADPQFLYFNLQSPHFPYHHKDMPMLLIDEPLSRSDINSGNARALRETYWNAVAYADQQLGELVNRLKAAGQWENSVVIVTGDHGEDLFEDGLLGHGHSVNQRQYGTFLVSNRPGMKHDGPIGLNDYRDIILSLMKGETPAIADKPVLMMVGELDAPTQIGIAQAAERIGVAAQRRSRITTLRLDTGEACLAEQNRCENYARLDGDFRKRVDLLIATWGSARWRAINR